MGQAIPSDYRSRRSPISPAGQTQAGPDHRGGGSSSCLPRGNLQSVLHDRRRPSAQPERYGHDQPRPFRGDASYPSYATGPRRLCQRVAKRTPESAPGPLACGTVSGRSFDVGGPRTAQEVPIRELRLDLPGHHTQSHASLVRHEGVRQSGQGPSVLSSSAVDDEATPRPAFVSQGSHFDFLRSVSQDAGSRLQRDLAGGMPRKPELPGPLSRRDKSRCVRVVATQARARLPPPSRLLRRDSWDARNRC